MRSRSRLLAPGKVSLNEVRCNPSSWIRFSPERTEQEGGSELFRTLIVDNWISYTVQAPWTPRDIVQEISGHSNTPIPIQSVADELREKVGGRGLTCPPFLVHG